MKKLEKKDHKANGELLFNDFIYTQKVKEKHTILRSKILN